MDFPSGQRLLPSGGLSAAILLFFLFSAAAPAIVHAHEDMTAVPSVPVLRIEMPPVIDGELDDQVWRDADPITQFWQRSPNMGAPATFPVSIRFATDGETVYIGFQIHSGDPSGLVSTVLQRDGGVNNYDDHFGFRFDTFHDHRDLYYFYINPKGTRLDGHSTDEGVMSDDNWDGVWEVKTKLIADGWQGEIALPLYNFRFKETPDGVWGFGCVIYVSETQENIAWPDMGKQSRKPSLFGHLTGLKGLDKPRPFVFTPYVLTGSQFGLKEKSSASPPSWQSVDDTWERDIGLDIRYRPTSNIETNLALNPDFATVEADQFLFNLSVDELQYPEKRPFFTEGQTRFETPIQLLYTRRIGLGDDEVIAGGKLHGRVGKYDFGVMDVVTGDGLDMAANYTALRMKRDILRSSTVGILAVGKNDASSGMDEINSAAGVDMNIQISGASRFVAQAAMSRRPGSAGTDDTEGFAGQAAYQYSNPLITQRDTFSWNTSVQAASDDFDIADIGYFGKTSLDRRGVKNSVGYSYWIKTRGINRVSVNQGAWYYEDFEGDRRTQNGLSGEFSIETLTLITPGVYIEKSYYLLPGATDSYDNTQRTFSLSFGPYPRIRGEVSYRMGDNFGSSIRYIDSEVILKPSDRMRITGNYSHLEQDPFGKALSSTTSDIGRMGLDVLFSPDMYWRIFVQSDSSDKLSLVNTLFRWEFRPGSVFYFAYKETRDDTLNDFTATDRRILAKVSYHLHR